MKVPDSTWPIRRFLDRLASAEPTPGGGSAAALAGALGCALGAMVSRILLSRSGVRTAEKRKLQEGLQRLEQARRRLEQCVRKDAAAYEQLVGAQRRGGTHLLRARKAAIECPLEICRETVRAMQWLKALSKKTGPYLGADLRGGQALLRGAFDSAMEMASINLRSGGLGPVGRRLQAEIGRLERDAEKRNGRP